MAPSAESALVTQLRDVARRRGSAVAAASDDERVSFAELWARAEAVAGALASRGLAGARVGLLCRPGSSWLEAFLGVVLAGGTAVALSPLYPKAELEGLVEASGARALVVSDDLMDLARSVAGNHPVLDVATLRADARRLPGAPTRDDGVALVLFTSGTTGKPKGARLTHRNVLALARTLGDAWRFTEHDVLLHTLPLHHLHGIGVSALVALAAGATTRFLPRFDAPRVWEELAHATVLMGVPTQHKKLFDAFDGADAGTRARWTAHGAALRLVTSGSAALPVALGERWRALAGQYPLERYGMTEVGIVLSNPEAGERRPGTVGLPLPGVVVRVVGESGSDVADGEPGELWVRAPTVIAGYDGDPLVTAASFTDGWFRTGDTVARSPDGYVKILGRTSVDILKSGGYKLSALEIEDVLREHEAVADVGVVGVPDDTWGDRVVAAIVLRAGVSAPSEASLRAWARERLAAYKVPKQVVFLAALPKNALGKIVKPELVRRIREVS